MASCLRNPRCLPFRFVKNVPPTERVIRVVISVAAAGAALALLPAPMSLAIAASAALFSFTGWVGFCPMCALAGRRLDGLNKA